MQEIFLSFNDRYYKPLLYGLKKYEYRKRFCDEETRAYLYLSGKTKKLVGILELGRSIRLDKTRDDYLDYPETLKRVDAYIESRDINAIPIKSLSLFKNPISLEELKSSLPGFMPPQMYYLLKNNPELENFLHSQKVEPPLFVHAHDKTYYDNLAVSVYELEQTPEFKEIEKKIQNDDDMVKL